MVGVCYDFIQSTFFLAVLIDSSIAMVVIVDGGSMTLSNNPSGTFMHQGAPSRLRGSPLAG